MTRLCFDGVARLIISPAQTSPVSLALRQDDAVGGRATCTTRWLARRSSPERGTDGLRVPNKDLVGRPGRAGWTCTSDSVKERQERAKLEASPASTPPMVDPAPRVFEHLRMHVEEGALPVDSRGSLNQHNDRGDQS